MSKNSNKKITELSKLGLHGENILSTKKEKNLIKIY